MSAAISAAASRQALHQVIPALQVACGERDDDPTWLLLENSAGHQGTIGVTIEELAAIIDELGRPDRVGICLDSCHLFASGYEIRTVDGMNAILDEVDERIGLDRLRCLHINDSKLPFGSRRDRHENVARGRDRQGHGRVPGQPPAAASAGHAGDSGARRPGGGRGTRCGPETAAQEGLSGGRRCRRPRRRSRPADPAVGAGASLQQVAAGRAASTSTPRAPGSSWCSISPDRPA